MVASSQKLPPSGRDFEIFRRVRVDECATRQVAAEMHLSQTRICQIVERVGAFLTEAVPGSDERRAQRVSVAEQLAAERIGALYHRAIQAFEETRGTFATTRESSNAGQMPANAVTTTKHCAGDGRYLMTAARLAVVGSRLPHSTLGSLIDYDVSVEEVNGPPVEDCSVNEAKQALRREFAREFAAVTATEHESCGQNFAMNVETELISRAPVQADCNGGDVLDFQAAKNPPPLTRQQRRARQRLLEKKLKKG